jgi:hypothetical protein
MRKAFAASEAGSIFQRIGDNRSSSVGGGLGGRSSGLYFCFGFGRKGIHFMAFMSTHSPSQQCAIPQPLHVGQGGRLPYSTAP